MAPSPLTIDGTRLRDSSGREITFRGINVSSDAKYPRHPDQASHIIEDFFDGDNVSFVGRPFTEEEAHIHFSQLKRWGYNSIRYIFTWEAIEHAGPGKYDEEFVQHTILMLRIAKSYDFHVFMDPHQDVWGRHSGGDGAPMWTYYAAGLDPTMFTKTHAAMVHNAWPDGPKSYPKMLWPTNYTRLAASTMFTLYWAGRDFAPKCDIGGKNIQDYLRDHFFDACAHLAQAIRTAGDLEDVCVIGWETMNEPNHGLVGWDNLDALPKDLQMKKGTMPTPWQSFLAGSGRAIEVDTYEFGSFGPYKSGTQLIDPEGHSAWLQTTKYDTHYGFERGSGWKLGTCIWAQHGVWEPKTDTLLLPEYFGTSPSTGKKLTYEEFTNTHFLDNYRRFRSAIRGVHGNCIILLQGPVLEIPPKIVGTKDDDERLIFASHYYDGLTLLTKHWNTTYNVDVFGVLRGKYWSPAFAVKFGITAIRNCLRHQLSAIRDEGTEYVGTHPMIFTEIGIPYDMDDKHAYKTGDYSAQTAALDANYFAIEGSGVQGSTLWTYCKSNNHEWSDNWNGEDLSVFSIDDDVITDAPLGISSSTNASTTTLTTTTSNSSSSSTAGYRKSLLSATPPKQNPDGTVRGLRAADAFIRPSPIATHGDVLSYGFDLKKCTFSFTLTATSKTPEESPTEIFLPDFHFPRARTKVQVSGGRWVIETRETGGKGYQWMKWWHAEGEQTMKVVGTVRKNGVEVSEDEVEDDYGYAESIRKGAENCNVM